MATALESILQIVFGKNPKADGVSRTATFDPNTSDRPLTAPLYTDHLDDIFTSRQADDSRTLLKSLFKNDPDVSAAVFSYLTMANTEPLILVRDMAGQIDQQATRNLMAAIKKLTVPTDYTLGFQLKKSVSQIAEELRYMALLRGGISAELVLDKTLAPEDIRIVDMADIVWYEKKPGMYKPAQKITGGTGGKNEISLDIPTFFVSFFRRDPTTIYSSSTFVSAINTIAARQQVINDLYRIMQKTGYPRLDISILEEVMTKNAPSDIKMNPAAMKDWMNSRLNEVRSAFENIRSDQALVHWDSIAPKILNDKNPGMGVDISAVIETLNAQNQAGLKTMSTVIGRGTAGVNTGSVEARIAAMNADELNQPVAEILTNMFSYILHSSGYQGFAEVIFAKAELRPDLELETMRSLKAARLRQDLSDGLISDLEYHLRMYNRLPPEGTPELSGTGFQTPTPVGGIDPSNASPNDDPLGRSLAPEGNKANKSKAVTKTNRGGE